MAFEDGDNGGDSGAAAGVAADLLGAAAAGDGQDGGAAGGAADGGADPAAGAAAGAEGAGGADPDWFSNVSAEAAEGDTSLRDWLKSTGVKDIEGLAKVARDNQRALRDSGRIKVPGDGATPEEITAYRKALGVPDEPTGYEFKAPTGADGQPLELNTPMLERIATAAHKHGLPKGPLEAVVADYVQGELDQLATVQREMDAKAQAWVQAQGQGATAKMAAIDRAASALGLTGADLQGLRSAWGPEKALSIMARLGEGMAEDTMITGGKGRFGVSAAEAQAEIDRLLGDSEFQQKVLNPNSPEAARWRRLNDAVGEAANRAAQ